MRWILPVIVISQFLCTSLWFAGNAVMSDLIKQYHIELAFLAHITSAVQFGFITGTLLFAVFTIADRFSPSLVFFISAIIAALLNLGLSFDGNNPVGLLVFRFLTGFFLAGIYPVGMKIASDYYQAGLGKSLGFLVGALVLGTAFPHLLKSTTASLPWKYVVYATSCLSVLGGLGILLFVPNGPHRRQGQGLRFGAFLKGFNSPQFRSVAMGYFGHMWELYAFWAFVPVMLTAYNSRYPEAQLNIPLLSFIIIGLGSIACMISGTLSQSLGTKKLAATALALSGICCVISPLLLYTGSEILLIAFLLFWGMVVIADSPLFSTLVAQNAPAESRGASLTIVNCIGFSITIISIQLINVLQSHISPQYIYLFLAPGPIIGLIALLGRKPQKS